jgi:hypothetical protein
MSKTKTVFIGGTKGGVGKSLTSHLACLGAILHNQPAAYVLTDPDREMPGEGRPYSVLDGREPKHLANILSASRSTRNGWLIIDGGGNRPSQEDVDTISKDMDRIANALAWPTAWPTNLFAIHAVQSHINRLSKKHPSRSPNLFSA